MALSDWDTLAINQKGEPTNGVIGPSPGGVTVEIYKNWLYVRDPAGWTEKGSFCEPTVMQVNSGVLRYKDVEIAAVRGPKNGIYCVVQWEDYKAKTFDAMYGIGCCGYVYSDPPCGDHPDEVRCGGCPPPHWAGVEAAEVEFLKQQVSKWEEDYAINKSPETWDRAIRFNQGDAYFADKLGSDLVASAPGEGNNPLMETLIEHAFPPEPDCGADIERIIDERQHEEH